MDTNQPTADQPTTIVMYETPSTKDTIVAAAVVTAVGVAIPLAAYGVYLGIDAAVRGTVTLVKNVKARRAEAKKAPQTAPTEK